MLMMVVLYALLDRKLREYGVVLVSKNTETMVRELRNQVMGSGSTIEKYPDDFDLYRLGEFDTETGIISAMKVQLVENVSTLLAPSAQLSMLQEPGSRRE